MTIWDFKREGDMLSGICKAEYDKDNWPNKSSFDWPFLNFDRPKMIDDFLLRNTCMLLYMLNVHAII